ncbi:heterokaryon incompatibility domain-containing protein [Trichoderma austrokoningii]
MPSTNSTCTASHTAVNRTSNPASTYRYSPLPANSIRLLRLQPNADEQAPIQCQLFDYPFVGSRKGTHLYEALSYVWGSEDKPRCVSTNEDDLYITENLHDALLRLRDCSLPRIIWADAICINQDDDEERGRQVEMMAEIYARASRVVVWLEEATNIRPVGNGTSDDIYRAFEAISSAASSQSVRFSDDKATRLAIHSLFQRSWFSRIWVLQEVAAARHVIIMCHLMDIDGYAFCEGLNALNLALEDPETQNLIRSAVYLIKTAVLRPKHASDRADRFSLNTRPLGELMDMYHNRKAKDWRDKVYALLGMSSDVIVGLSPNYSIPWSDLFHQLIHSIIGEQASVRTWDNRQIAVIKSLGYVLGIVSSVSSTRVWDDKQNLWKSDCIWTLQASANPIQQGDVVCLLQGASKPTIVRLNEDYCTIIAISVTPGGIDQPEEITFNWKDELSQAGFPGPGTRPNGQLKEMPATWQEYIQKKKSLSRQFLLIWDWEMPCEGLRRIDYERVLKNRRYNKGGYYIQRAWHWVAESYG